jgi:hypothetical protein
MQVNIKREEQGLPAQVESIDTHDLQAFKRG